MVPEGWKIKSLGEICDGNLQTGPFGSQLHANEYTASGTPVLMPKDFVDGKVNLSGAAKISHNRASDLSKHKLQTGDLLFSRRGDVTRFALITEDVAGALCGTGCLRARPSSKHTPLFLAYFLQKNAVQKWLEQNAVGQTMPNMNTAILSELPLMVSTNTDEEEKIARILSTWDKAIETVEKLIENSQAQKKALMQQLLTGKRRLPGFDGKWEKAYLEDIADITMGSSPNSDFYNDIGNGLPLVQGNADIKDRKTAPRVYTSQVTKTCSKGDILLSVRAPVGAVAISEHNACIGRGIASISERDNVPLAFIYHLLLVFESKWGQLSQGSTFDAVNSKDIKRLKISIPSLRKEQQKIASVLTTVDQEIQTLQQKRDCLKQEKKALMQQLLTGKRRVKVGADG